MSLQRDSIATPDHQIAGVLSGSRDCPYCDHCHGPEVVFCPATGMALPGAKDEFCGTELPGGFVSLRPIRRSDTVGFYEGQAQEGFKVLIKRLLPPCLDSNAEFQKGTEQKSSEEFRREGKVLALLTDLHFVPRLLLADERRLATEWIEGPRLSDRLDGSNREHPAVGLQDAIDWSLSLISSVRILHGRHLYHQAICSDNIILKEPDDSPVLTGFENAVVFDSKQSLAGPPSKDSGPGDDRDPAEQETNARNRDLAACSSLTYQLLLASLGHSQPENSDREIDPVAAVQALPEPLAQPLAELLQQLQSTRAGLPLTLLVNQLESLRIHADRHLKREESPADPVPVAAGRSESTQPVNPIEHRDTPPLGTARSPRVRLVWSVLALGALIGALWFLVVGRHGNKAERNEPASRSPMRRRPKDEAGQKWSRPAMQTESKARIRPEPRSPRTAGELRPAKNHEPRPGQASNGQRLGSRPRQSLHRHQGGRRPRPGPQKARGPASGEDDFVHAVDNNPEDL